MKRVDERRKRRRTFESFETRFHTFVGVLQVLVERLVRLAIADFIHAIGRQEPILEGEGVVGEEMQILVSREEFAFLGGFVQLRGFEYRRVVRAARLANANVAEFVVVTGHTQEDDGIPTGRICVTCTAITWGGHW